MGSINVILTIATNYSFLQVPYFLLKRPVVIIWKTSAPYAYLWIGKGEADFFIVQI